MKIFEKLCAAYTAAARCHLEARKALHELPSVAAGPRQLCLCIPRGVCGDYRPQHTADWLWLCTRAKSELNARINELEGGGRWRGKDSAQAGPCLFGRNCICPAGEKFLIDATNRDRGAPLPPLPPFCCKFVVRLLNSIHLQSVVLLTRAAALATHLSTQLSDPTCPYFPSSYKIIT